jgi:competence protein ComFC
MFTACIRCQQPFDRPFSWWQWASGGIFRSAWHTPLENWLCRECLEQVTYIGEPACLRCGRQTLTKGQQEQHDSAPAYADRHPAADEQQLCQDCARWLAWEQKIAGSSVLSLNRSVLPYHSPLSSVFETYKFRGDVRLKYFFASLFIHHSPLLKSVQEWQIERLVPIPLPDNRQRERGFNQVELIAQLLSVHSGIPLQPGVLRRENDSAVQSRLNRAERLQEMLKKFLKNSERYDDILNRNVLLIDDVYTTGATLHAAAYHVTQLGANRVYSITIFR